MNKLLELIGCGQSYWLDNLTRAKILNGELDRRVREDGLRGVTTNPSIFNKAISNSDDYDNQLIDLYKQGKPVHEVYEELAIKDVQSACDILRKVYDESGGIDGFVSLEVSPNLAHDTEGTMIEARRLFATVDRVNSFIKIPATEEGIPAIEEMLYEGININVTLIFSLETYKAVAEAYISALERRVSQNKPVARIRSVASFFLSRIDTLVDRLLSEYLSPSDGQDEWLHPEELMGKTAIANARQAYKAFKRIFSGERWEALAAKSAMVQRPLWASTGTKNPKYSDVKYVEALIGRNTVNTLPEETIAAFSNHGVVVKDSIELNMSDTEKVSTHLKLCGIDMRAVSQQLLDEGLIRFKKDYDNLLSILSEKKDKLLTNASVLKG